MECNIGTTVTDYHWNHMKSTEIYTIFFKNNATRLIFNCLTFILGYETNYKLLIFRVQLSFSNIYVYNALTPNEYNTIYIFEFDNSIQLKNPKNIYRRKSQMTITVY